MNISIGIDIGSVRAKLAACLPEALSSVNLDKARKADFHVINKDQHTYILSPVLPTHGDPQNATHSLLQLLSSTFPEMTVTHCVFTGCINKAFVSDLRGTYVNDFRALAMGAALIHPEAATILEMGGNSSRYIRVDNFSDGDHGTILDYAQNGDCAAGTGSFLDLQASRLLFKVEDIGRIVAETKRTASIAGRCSVFAKSDMIHAQQRGFTPAEVLKGLCLAVARNFKGTILHGRELTPKITFVGGVALNRGVSDALFELLNIDESEFIIPSFPAHISAIGCAAIASQKTENLNTIKNEETTSTKPEHDSAAKLSTRNLKIMRDLVQVHPITSFNESTDAYLGIDIGSVSTNVAVLDSNGNLLKEIYTKTNARPIEVVSECLNEIATELGENIIIKGVGTTGSGRELIGELIGADTINDEITAHMTGANFIARRYNIAPPDTIFEIGGQDSKYIFIQNGVVVDFAMNEACAAGTGSFLEEQAERLGINIIGEFSDMALRSKNPLRLGERCTVFMEKDVAVHLQKGVDKKDIASGLAYSVALNYLNRVVSKRAIGTSIYFQGGTAYNDSVAAALSQILEKPIIIPPFNGVMGAIGMALLEQEKIEATGRSSTLRGLSFKPEDVQVRYFTCKGCTNYCYIQEFTINGEKSYWGDKCSERFRKQQKVDYTPNLPDFFELHDSLLEQTLPGKNGYDITVGIPRAMYFHEQLPFWSTFFQHMGVDIILSDNTSRRHIESGIESTIAEPCFPIIVTHGHVAELLTKNIDYLFLPNIINAEKTPDAKENFLCPWVQTIPWVVRNSHHFEEAIPRILIPTIRFKDGVTSVKKALYPIAKKFNISQKICNEAVDAAYAAQNKFTQEYKNRYKKQIDEHLRAHKPAILLVGRPYNIYDPAVNLDIGRKLRKQYGIDVIPLDALDVDTISLSDIHPNMFWNYGQRILKAAKLASRHPHLHVIYITNFKCGPDSYVKHFIRKALGKSFLTLQFDGHNNDAGMLTRCEAFLDSIGFLRRWRMQETRTEQLCDIKT